MISIVELLDAARSIRPKLPTLLDAETALQVDQHLAGLLNQLDQQPTNNKATAQQIRTLLQSHPSTKKWLTDFAETVTRNRSNSLAGDPILGHARFYICPQGNDYTWTQEGTEEIPLCPTHLVRLVRAQQ